MDCGRRNQGAGEKVLFYVSYLSLEKFLRIKKRLTIYENSVKYNYYEINQKPIELLLSKPQNSAGF